MFSYRRTFLVLEIHSYRLLLLRVISGYLPFEYKCIYFCVCGNTCTTFFCLGSVNIQLS